MLTANSTPQTANDKSVPELCIGVNAYTGLLQYTTCPQCGGAVVNAREITGLAFCSIQDCDWLGVPDAVHVVICDETGAGA